MSQYFTEEHLMIEINEDIATAYLTEQARTKLGNFYYIESPVDDLIKPGDTILIIETSKLVLEIKSPVTGNLIAINDELISSPELLKDSGIWLLKIALSSKQDKELSAMLSEKEYLKLNSEE